VPDEDRGNSFHSRLAQASNSAVTAALKRGVCLKPGVPAGCRVKLSL
jgi:hypothetical protein